MALTQNEYPTIYPKRIHLLGEARHEQLTGSGTISPGYLIEVNSSGDVQPHSTAAGATAELMFAEEDALQGNGIETDYADGDLVSCLLGQANTEVYAWLKAGESIDTSTFLESAGDGTLQPRTSGKAVAKSLETLSSASDATKTRIRVRCV